ncbi:MAG: hypothetical protein M1833_003454 [Piccolia ochrophora]|nr:MAG: hypothetical protein M1833_003454 [Piccolia ochrophora]
MAKQKGRSLSRGANSARLQQTTTPTQEESDQMGQDDHKLGKDTHELELERLVFGDDEDFRQGLKEHDRSEFELDSEDQDSVSVQSHSNTSETEQQRLTDVDDADLFFIDAGPADTANDSLIPTFQAEELESTLRHGHAAAWEDSDDERMMVSLASNPRLRKLRISEAEDMVDGKEYSKRLRRQFERLYPVPEWALPSAAKKASKKRNSKRRSEAVMSTDDEFTSDSDGMDVDMERLSARPLAKLLQSSNDLTVSTANGHGKRRKLRPEVLDIQRCKDVGDPQPSAITSLSFHPTHPFLLSSGPASTVYLHHASPSSQPPNPLLTSLHVRSTPLATTSFLPPNGTRIFLSGRRRYFHVWDLPSGRIDQVTRVYGHGEEQRSMERFKLSPCGRWMALVGSTRKDGGAINVLNANTTQWVAQARVEGRGGVADFAWWADGQGLCIVGKGGEVVEWDLEAREVVARWTDDGGVGITVLTLGGARTGAAVPNENSPLGGMRWVAIGSQSGIVTVYDRRTWRRSSPDGSSTIPARPKPAKTFAQLTTPVSNVVFSPDGQLLAISSRWKKDALRLSQFFVSLFRLLPQSLFEQTPEVQSQY